MFVEHETLSALAERKFMLVFPWMLGKIFETPYGNKLLWNITQLYQFCNNEPVTMSGV